MIARRALLATQAAGLWLSFADGWLRPVHGQTRGPFSPWNVATHRDSRLQAIAWAVLAPSAQNRQPWLIRLEGEDELLLYADLDRRLPAADPLDRQTVIGLGCFAELLRIAAAWGGVEADITPFPEGAPQPRLDTRPIARILFSGTQWRDPLFTAAARRRSARQPFDIARGVSDAALLTLRSALLAPAGFGARNRDVGAIRDLVWRAWLIEAETAAAQRETVDLMRFGAAEVAARPDGIVAQGGLTRAAMRPGQPGHRAMIRRNHAMLAATNAYVWLTTPENDRAAQLAAGRDWVRLNLSATLAGLALHPVSQALQEYPEMAAPRAALPELLGARGHVQMLGRLGYASRATPPTPRWPAASRMLG